MMGARTASAQLGYLIGAVVGGVVLALSGFGALGFVLFAGMAGRRDCSPGSATRKPQRRPLDIVGLAALGVGRAQLQPHPDPAPVALRSASRSGRA